MHDEVLAMVEQFYHSDAVSHPVPMEKLEQTFADAVSEDSILEGFVLNEDDITTNLLVDKVHELYFNRQKYVEAMSRSHQMDAVNTIMSLINEAANKSHTQ